MKNIFAVEDNESLLTEFYNQLLRANPTYCVTATLNPYTALRMATKERPSPDLLVTGFLGYSIMTGPELIKRVHRAGLGTKFVLCHRKSAESELITILEELDKEQIDVRCINFMNVIHPPTQQESLGALVMSMLDE